MSRIAGIVSQRLDLQRVMAAMLEVYRSSARVKLQIECQLSNHVTFGWAGWKNRNLIARDAMLLVCDGCLYNPDISREPEAFFDFFLSLYKRFGFVEAIGALHGDFAIGLFDQREQKIWLGRDRLGVKPLYYYDNSDFFAFASRPAALLTIAEIDRTLDPGFIARFAACHYRYFDSYPQASPYSKIRQLPAAHCLCWDRGVPKVSAYWKLEKSPDREESDEVLAEEYRQLLLDSVEQRYRQTKSPGFTLSGGLDSSSVLACAVENSGHKQNALSTIYRDKTYDESAEIQSMLETKVSHWHTVTVDVPDVFSLVRAMIALHDEPVATATWLSHYLLCGSAAGLGMDSLFGGLGGDELNAGEYEYFYFHFADIKKRGNEKQLHQEVTKWIEYHDHPIFRKNMARVEDSLRKVVDLSVPGLCLPDLTRLYRYAAALSPDYYDLRKFQPPREGPFDSYLKNRAYQDLFWETLPCCLRAEDRHTTAFELDNFLPFLDHRLVEFMFKIPGRLKIKDGVTKRLLRSAMSGILPEQTRTRVKKTGWNAPAHIWFSGKGRDQLNDLIHSSAFRNRGIYNLVEVERIIDDHEKIVSEQLPRENHMMFLWQLVNLELWLSSRS